MSRPATFDNEKGARARALFDAGLSCREIATEVHASTSTVSRWAAREGLSFDRARTALASRARAIDLEADRIALARELVVVARDGMKRLDEPHLVFNFGGRDNTYAEHELEKVPVDVVRSIVVIAGIAFDKATKAVEKSTDSAKRAGSLVDHLEQYFEQIDKDSDD